MSVKFQLKNSHILFLCIFLSILAFAVDLSIRWAIGGLIYIAVVLLSLQSTKNKYPYIFTILSSAFIVLSLLIVPPASQPLRVLTNHFLVLIILWLMLFWFSNYKEKGDLNSRFVAIVNSSEDAIWSITLDGRISSWNKSSQNMFGYTHDEIVGQSNKILVPDQAHGMLPDMLTRLRNGERIRHHETVRLKKDGSSIHVSLSISPIRDLSGNLVGGSVIARDISERIQADKLERELKNKIYLEKTKLEQVLSLDEGLHKVLELNKLVDFVVDKTAKILKASKCSLMLVDEQSKELCLRGYVGLKEEVVSKARLKVGEPIAGIIAFDGKAVLVENIETDSRFSRENRPSYQSKSFISAPIKLGDQILGVLNVTDKQPPDDNTFTELDLKVLCMIVRQVGVAMEASRLYRDLKFLTITDPLTGIYNFRYFTNILEREISRAKRYERPLCILMIDVDDFKKYNDTFGHLEGDILLKELSKMFNENIRDIDVTCRYAGDEFVIILPDTKMADAQTVARKIMTKVKELKLLKEVNLSIGIAQLPVSKNFNRYDLMLKADSALYQAKKEGKNRIQIYE